MNYQSPLRDLIAKISATAQSHIAFPQAADAIRNLTDHLSAIARCEEQNRDDNDDHRSPQARP